MNIRIILLAIVLIGCGTGSRSPYYYSLINNTAGNQKVHTLNSNIVIIEPVTLARFLNSPKIAYQQSPTEIVFFNHHLWVEDLSQQVTQFLVIHLRDDIQGMWIDSSQLTADANTTRVRLSLNQFQGSFTGAALISGEWQLIKNNKVIYVESFSYSIPLKQQGYDALISALSSGLERLSKAISKRIKRLSR